MHSSDSWLRSLAGKNKPLPPGDVTAILESEVLQTAIPQEIDKQVAMEGNGNVR